MTLVPVKETFNKSGDPLFNQVYAEQMYTLVSKMDPDSAEMFVYLVTCEVLDADIQKNLRTLQKHVDEVIAKRLTRIAKAAVKVGVDLDDLEIFAKKTPYDYGYIFREQDFNRDPSTGRFRTKIKHTQTKPMKDHAAVQMGIPNKKSQRDLKGKTKAQFQEEYLQIARFLGSYSQSTPNPGDGSVLLTVQNKHSQDTFQVPMKLGTKVDTAAWDPNTERVLAVEARPAHLSAGGLGFNLATAMGASPEGAHQAANRTENLHRNLPRFADDWTEQMPEDVQNSNARLYRRTKTAGELTQSLSGGNTTVHAAGKFAELVGQHGPEAERVIGPAARKTAYRYRGTEKTPDRRMVAEYNAAIANAKSGTRGPGRAPHQMVQHRIEDATRPPTWEERAAGRAAVVAYLGGQDFGGNGDGKLPNKRLYGLQLASGTTPPSQGVLIDRKGQVVAEAVGYGDDHYLPFNLKNLKHLKGGEYVRTRSVGGPTAEDIYTGLITGARQVTVISRSGIFTVEFDETFKGGRRYNDKAMRMTDRYEHLLDAVQSEQVDANPVPLPVQEMIRREVAEEFPDWSKKDQRTLFNERIEEYKTFDGLDEHDNQIIEMQVAREFGGDSSSRDAKKMRSALVSQAMAEKEFKYRLNGEGYASALKALEEQFPYYISVQSVPRREAHVTEQEKDKGYVMPKHNRPTAALSGYFDPRIAGEGKTLNGVKTGKVSAAETNFQNHRNAGARAKTEDATEGEKASFGGTDKPVSEETQLAERAAEKRDETTFANEARKVFWAVEWAPEHTGALIGAARARDESKFLDLLKTPEGRAQAMAALDQHGALLQRGNPDAYRKALDAGLTVDRKNYTVAESGVLPSKPFKFPGEAYTKAATKQTIEREISKVEAKVKPVTSVKKYSEMADDELRAELDALVQLKSERASIGAMQNPEARAKVLGHFGITDASTASKLIAGGDAAIQSQIDALHKLRLLALNLKSAPEAKTPAKAAPAQVKMKGGTATLVKDPARVKVFEDLMDGPTKRLEQAHGNEGHGIRAVNPAKAQAIRALLDEGVDIKRRVARGESVETDEGLDWVNRADKLLGF